jgi:hypothetical protein
LGKGARCFRRILICRARKAGRTGAPVFPADISCRASAIARKQALEPETPVRAVSISSCR